MLRLLKKKNTIAQSPDPGPSTTEKSDAKQTLDEIEAAVYAHLKPLGFRKHGRTLHRFVSGDISQVVSFQVYRNMMEPSDKFCVNLGIRIPECAERTFHPVNDKKYYSEASCTLRSRLGMVSGNGEVWFSITENTEALTKRIIEELDRYALPVFDVLCSREAILARRRDYPQIDTLNRNLILLEECFIYGYLGDLEKAKERFDVYYQEAVAKYDRICRDGEKIYLNKGERCIVGGQEIHADHSGYYTVFNPIPVRRHIEYLDKLAVELGFREASTPG